MKYKRIILSLLLVLFIFSFAEAQKRKKKRDLSRPDTTTISPAATQQPSPQAATPSPSSESKVQDAQDSDRMNTLLKMYALGFRYYDLTVSQMALYEMIAMDLDNVSLRDSLALLYYNMGKYGSAIAVATDVLAVEKNNLAMLEVKALSNESLQFYNDALNDYEKLYLLSPSPYLLYKMATLQYTTKKQEQTKTNIAILLNNSEIDSLTVDVPVNRAQQQQVPLRAAVLNLRGLLYQDLGNKEEAKKSFAEALKLSPDYRAAKANQEALAKAAPKKK